MPKVHQLGQLLSTPRRSSSGVAGVCGDGDTGKNLAASHGGLGLLHLDMLRRVTRLVWSLGVLTTRLLRVSTLPPERSMRAFSSGLLQHFTLTQSVQKTARTVPCMSTVCAAGHGQREPLSRPYYKT